MFSRVLDLPKSTGDVSRLNVDDFKVVFIVFGRSSAAVMVANIFSAACWMHRSLVFSTELFLLNLMLKACFIFGFGFWVSNITPFIGSILGAAIYSWGFGLRLLSAFSYCRLETGLRECSPSPLTFEGELLWLSRKSLWSIELFGPKLARLGEALVFRICGGSQPPTLDLGLEIKVPTSCSIFCLTVMVTPSREAML